MNTLLILYGDCYPSHTPASNRIRLYGKALEKVGLNVKVMPTNTTSKGRLKSYANLMLAPWLIFFKTLFLAKEYKVIFIYGYGWVSLFLIRFATFLTKKKIVLEVNEKPYAPYGNLISELRLIKHWNKFVFNNLIIPSVDGFVVISENLSKYIYRYKNSQARIIKVPILIDPEEMLISTKAHHLQKPFLLHAGALSERKDGIIGVFEAFAIANKKLETGLHFYLTDKSAPAEIIQKIKSIISFNGLAANVHFLGKIPKLDLLALQDNCSMLILNKPDNEQNQYNFPTKLGEFLALGKPVIYTPVGEMKEYLKGGVNAFEIPTNNVQYLADQIVEIIQNKSVISSIALKGRELAFNEFYYLHQGNRLADFFRLFQNN